MPHIPAITDIRKDDYRQDVKVLDDIRSDSVASPAFGTSPHGIDAEIAELYKDQVGGIGHTVTIDAATNIRLRNMVHKRVLIVMVITFVYSIYLALALACTDWRCRYFAQVHSKSSIVLSHL